jgi:hypothetical protein
VVAVVDNKELWGAMGAKALALRADTPTAKARTTNTTFFIMLLVER